MKGLRPPKENAGPMKTQLPAFIIPYRQLMIFCYSVQCVKNPILKRSS